MKTLDAYFDRGGAVRERFGDAVGATWREGILDAEVIARLRAEHMTGVADRSSELFGIMMFDRWWGTYVDAGSTERPSPEVRGFA
jgi:hypothetical protein